MTIPYSYANNGSLDPDRTWSLGTQATKDHVGPFFICLSEANMLHFSS